MFDVYISLHSSEHKNIPLEEVTITPEEIKEIEKISQRDDLMELFVRSIAPSIIVGDTQMNSIKKSLILQLFGGVSRKFSDGTRTRGDIHILLLGDPGVAKSQLLSFMGTISPRGRFTTGGGTSAAGLTAAAVRDAFNDGRFSLEAGALVLADMGLCAIDEFDKMSGDDRGSMHEAMEQQRININKGGVSATMPTRCAVLAAANPNEKNGGRLVPVIDGEPSTYLINQIDLPQPLITRFDIVWMIKDDVIEARDRKIGEHIIRMKRRGTPEHLIESGEEVEPQDTQKGKIYARNVEGEDILTSDFVQKYVAYCKRNFYPKCDEEPMNILVDYYTHQRKEGQGSGNTVSLTARSIEGTLRMAEARARLFLRSDVTEEDAQHSIAMDKLWRYLSNEADLNTDDYSGIPKKTQSAERMIHSIVSTLIRELGGECVTNDIYNAAAEQSFNEDTVDRVLSTLRTRGTLWCPRLDIWRLA
jgi:replicative DNA helicase Mcm